MSLEFSSAFKSKNLDSSEYVLLLIGYIQHIKGIDKSELSVVVNNAFKSYAYLNYPEAIDTLLSFLESKESLIENKMIEIIKSRKDALKDDPNQDHNRRFFETIMAKVIVKNATSYESINKLLEEMKASSKYTKDSLEKLPEVKNYKDVKNVLTFVHDFESVDDTKSMKEEIKDKLLWEAMSAKMKYSTPKGELTESRNRGVMKSITPNFYDFITKDSRKGRHPDLTSYSKEGREDFDLEEDVDQDDYFKAHPEVPYVESLSGTTCSLIGIILQYLANHKDDQTENLNKDVNSIIKLFIAFYINHGFHSLGEIKAICEHEFVKSQFHEYGVEIDLNFSEKEQHEILKQALPYTKTTCIKKAMHDELKENDQKTSRRPFNG